VEKETVTANLDSDIAEAFARWRQAVGLSEDDAGQLAVWVLMHLESQKRKACLDLMRARGELTREEIKSLIHAAGG